MLVWKHPGAFCFLVLSLTVITTHWVFCNHSSTQLHTHTVYVRQENGEIHVCACTVFCEDYSCESHVATVLSPGVWHYSIIVYLGVSPTETLCTQWSTIPWSEGRTTVWAVTLQTKTTQASPWRPAMQLINRWLVCFLMDWCAVSIGATSHSDTHTNTDTVYPTCHATPVWAFLLLFTPPPCLLGATHIDAT